MTSDLPPSNPRDSDASPPPVPPAPPGPEAPPAPSAENEPPTPSPRAPGLTTFSIEGRQAPGLFVVGWLASILGAGILVIGFAGPRGLAPTLLVLIGLVILSLGLIAAAGSQAIERRAAALPYTGPSPVLLFAACVAVSSVGASLVALVARVVGLNPESLVVTIVVLAVIQATYLGLTRLLVVGTGALTWTEIGFRPVGRPALAELATGMTYAIPIILVTVVIAALATLILPVVPESPLPPTGSAPGLLLNLLGGAVLVPLGEETMFRGVTTTAWRRTSGVQRAIVQGALFFAIVHVLQVGGSSPAQALALAVVAFVTRVPVGLALGWLFLTRRSIWASIGLHGAFNGLLLILAEIAVRSGAT
jgi:membrane protease YdiL (CAAX protease family)